MYIHKNPDTLQKSRQFALRFYLHKNPDTFRFAKFHEILENWHLYKKA